jgi:hypothetical protein
MQCFTVWISMEFVHACCLSLYLQFQSSCQRSHRGGSANRTKGSATMSHGRRPSKRVRSTPLEQAAWNDLNFLEGKSIDMKYNVIVLGDHSITLSNNSRYHSHTSNTYLKKSTNSKVTHYYIATWWNHSEHAATRTTSSRAAAGIDSIFTNQT